MLTYEKDIIVGKEKRSPPGVLEMFYIFSFQYKSYFNKLFALCLQIHLTVNYKLILIWRLTICQDSVVLYVLVYLTLTTTSLDYIGQHFSSKLRSFDHCFFTFFLLSLFCLDWTSIMHILVCQMLSNRSSLLYSVSFDLYFYLFFRFNNFY